MPRSKTNPIVLWWYKQFHLNDDWCVAVRDCNNIRAGKTLESFATPWFFKAFWKWIMFHFKYPEDTIIFSHYRYPEV